MQPPQTAQTTGKGRPMKYQMRHIKKAKQTHKQALETLQQAALEKEQAIKRKEDAEKARQQAEEKARQIEEAWISFAQSFGATEEEARQLIAKQWLLIDEAKATNAAVASTNEQFKVRLDQEATRLAALQADLQEREADLQEREKTLARQLADRDLKKARRRLVDRTKERDDLQRQNASLFAEVNRLTGELAVQTNLATQAANALELFAERFGVTVRLDLYRSEDTTFYGSGYHLKIPDAGLVFEFLDEEILVTPADFHGVTDVSLELFCKVVNKQKAPKRWRVGMKGNALTLFARGLYKVEPIEIMQQQKPEAQQAQKSTDGPAQLSDVKFFEAALIDEKDAVHPSHKILTTVTASQVEDLKRGDASDQK